MIAAGKRTYYESHGLRPAVAARYYRQFGDARRILDVGCGTGDFGSHRPADTYEIHGVDVDEDAVLAAQAHEHAVRVDLEHETLPFEDESFEGVLARDVLEHIVDVGRLVREIFRVLEPRGVLLASVVIASPRRVWGDYTHVRGFTRNGARLLLEDSGFVVEAIEPMGAVPLSSRLGLLDAVPYLLRVPGFFHLWTSSWELRARKP